ncbi:MAG: hypothetical protein SPL15_08595 [Lachnospiraceae bacterium]|nr:hypothetical protein [Lachnospiraceae bacterium]
MAKKQKVYQVIHKRASANGRRALPAVVAAYFLMVINVVLSAMGWLGRRQVGAGVTLLVFVLAMCAVYWGRRDFCKPEVKRAAAVIATVAGGLMMVGIVVLWLWGALAGAV